MPRAMTLIISGLLGVALPQVSGQTCPGAVPAADSCSAPSVIPGTPGQHVVMVDASAASGSTTICGQPDGRTVWFEVTPEVSSPITVSTCHPATAYDTVLQVFSGGNSECQGMTIEDCEDDSQVERCDNGCSFFGSEIVFNAVAGVRYRIEVGSYGDNAAGCPLCLGLIVTLGDPCGEPPTNIVCDTATELPGTPGTHEARVDVQDAIVHSDEPIPSCSSPIGHSVWFKTTPDVSGPLRFSTCHPNTHFDTVVSAYEGNCGMLAALACNDDDFGTGGPACVSECGKPFARSSTVAFDAVAGETYYFQVGSYNENSAGCELCLGAQLMVSECDDDGDCDDGNPCTADSCTDVMCVNGREPFGSPCPPDANECTRDICNGEGSCTHPPSPKGTACGDQSESECDGPDMCDGAGSCSPSLAPFATPCGSDNVECTDDICNLDGVCTHPIKANGTPCGDPSDTDCNEPDTCLEGVCLANLVPSGTACPDDGNECTRDECIAGTCSHPPVDAGTPCGSQSSAACDRPDTCNGAGGCEPNFLPAGTSCSDGMFCNGEELCDGSGVCGFGTPPCGPDGVCIEEAGRCETEPVPGSCRDPGCDADGDLDVDAMDHAEFRVCLLGPETVAPSQPSWCTCFDHDGDESISLRDWATLQNCYRGENVPADLACDGQLPESLRPDERASLAAVGISTDPAYPAPGENATVFADVLNRSAERAASVGVRLHADGLDVGFRRVYLDPGQTQTLEFGWTAPIEEGASVLTAVVDPDEEFVDNDRIDNAASRRVLVSGPPPIVTDFSITELTYVVLPDRPVVPRVAVRSSGSEPARAPLVFINDGELIAELLTDAIPSGETAWIDLPWPSDSTPGRFEAEINPRYKTAESNPDDNVFTRTFTLSAELRVEGLTVHALQFEAGWQQRATVSFRVTNDSTGPVNVPFQTTIDLGPVGTYHVVTPDLQAGETLYVSRSAYVQSIEPGFDGRFDIRVEADSQNVIAELNESNNVATSRFHRSSPEIGHWVSIGPRRITGGLGAVGRFHKLAVTPSGPEPDDPLIIYAGAPSGSRGDPGGCGIWKSPDGGRTWDPVGDSMPSLAVVGLAVAPTDPSRVYAVTDEGVFRTEDGGVSWGQISTQDLQASSGGGTRLLIDPDEPDRMYIPSQSNQGILRSSDGGVSWTSVLGNGTGTDLIMDPDDPQRLYAALRNDSNLARTGIWQSTDGGDDWVQLAGCPGGRLPTITGASTIRIAQSGNTLYAGYKTPGDVYTVYGTTDIGCNIGGVQERLWEKLWQNDKAERELWSWLFADPDDAKYVYASGVKLFVSTDGGKSFRRMAGPQPHDDFHDILVDPRDSKKLYVACDGGIYFSNNRAAANSWSFIGEGIANIEFYDIANARTDPGMVIGGTQDNGTMRYDGMSTLWQQIRGGDGSTVDIDPTNKSILYSMNQFACSMARMIGNADWAAIACQLPSGTACRDLHYQVNPADPSEVLASCQSTLWQADDPECTEAPNCDAGTTGSPQEWTQRFTPPAGNGGVQRSTVDASINLHFAGTSNGRIYAGPNGANYERLFVHPGSRGVTDIEVDPLAPRFFYASFGGTNANRVFRFRRNSPAPRAADVDFWSMDSNAVSQRIPTGLSVRTIAVDRNAPLTIYAGTSGGVYRGRSTDNGVTWNWDFYNEGMPPAVDVKDLEIHPTTGVMRAATLGRGAYEVLTAPRIGTRLAAVGRLNLLRVHDVGTGFGPPGDLIDGEVVVGLDTHPDLHFGYALRTDPGEAVHGGMLETLRMAFAKDRRVRIEYIRTGFRNGRIVRVMQLP